mgnify:FL=1
MRFSLGKIIALCGAAAMVVPLAACGTTQSETPDGSGKTVVNVWAWDNNLKANAKVFMKKTLTLSSNLPMPVVVKMNTKL